MESGKTFVKKDFDKTDKAKDKAILKNFFSKGNSKLNRYIKSLYIERRRATRKAWFVPLCRSTASSINSISALISLITILFPTFSA